MVNKSDSVFETPMMRQYLSMKERYTREILFFRMGDFYEMFFDDAKEAAGILGITLTSRSKDKNGIPMAGVPVKAVDTYLPRLLKAGKRVAICEQTQDPKEAKGIVERDVVRVISPGTITDERLIGEKANNYIVSVVAHKKAYGLAWLDVSTGQFLVWESPNVHEICSQLSRLEPAECLLPEGMAFSMEGEPILQAALSDVTLTPYADILFEKDTARRSLTEHFGTRTLEGFGCEQMGTAVCAGGALLHYVSGTQRETLSHITKVAPFLSQRFVPIDRATRQALELTETYRSAHRDAALMSVFDKTSSALGARKLRDWLLNPLLDVAVIVERQDAVETLFTESKRREELRQALREIHDLERICTRISYRTANARDLVSLRRTLELLPSVRDLVVGLEPSLLQRLSEQLRVDEELRLSLDRTLVDEPPLAVKEGGLIREGFSEELDELREIASQGTRWLARYQQEEIDRTSIPSLKVGFNKVFGYYLEVTNPHLASVPDHYVRKQTLKNCERYVTADLKDYEAKVLKASDRSVDLEYEMFVELRDGVAAYISTLQSVAEAIAVLDVVATFAELASLRGYVRPLVDDSTRLSIRAGRHPVLETVPQDEEFVPNDIELDDATRLMVITGPNMAGKSTYMRQVAILVLLAQSGSFVPAAAMEVGVVDRIFTRVGAADDLSRGQSTFMVEMNETANILNNASARSLLILDEVGRGTSTFDGVSLAWAITEHLASRIGARTLFATHYHELTALAAEHGTVRNYNFAVKEWNDSIVFLRKVVEGGSDKSYGIHVARLAGIPAPILERARELLSGLESQALRMNTSDSEGTPAQPRPRATLQQLDLFQNPNEQLLQEVRKLDIDTMAPIEALKILSDLQAKIV